MIGLLGSSEVFQTELVRAIENLTNSTTTLPSTIVQVIRVVWPQVLILPTKRKNAITATKVSLDNITNKIWNEAKGNDVDTTRMNTFDVLGQLLPFDLYHSAPLTTGQLKRIKGRASPMPKLLLMYVNSCMIRTSDLEWYAQLSTLLFVGVETASAALAASVFPLGITIPYSYLSSWRFRSCRCTNTSKRNYGRRL
jgi:hypothetical protein